MTREWLPVAVIIATATGLAGMCWLWTPASMQPVVAPVLSVWLAGVTIGAVFG